MPQNIQVLVVDDDAVDRRAVARLLAESFTVLEATDGEHAKAMLSENGIACVLLDYAIPGTDTHQLLAQIGRESAVIILTGHDDVVVAVRAMKEGAQDFLVKTNLTQEALLRAIGNAIDKVAMRRQIEQQRRELEFLATTDGLTGLHNRRCLMARLEQEIIRVHRFQAPFSLLMIDLDHFKAVNDQHGHLVGDQVLAHIAGILRACLRESDFAARYGGEEFCILASGTSSAGAEVFANRLRALVAKSPFLIKDRDSLAITCSIGVAETNSTRLDAGRLIEAADQALYQAKHAGRNRVVRV